MKKPEPPLTRREMRRELARLLRAFAHMLEARTDAEGDAPPRPRRARQRPAASRIGPMSGVAVWCGGADDPSRWSAGPGTIGRMGDKYYAHEKFGAAVRYLSVNDGARRDLLRDARGFFSAITEADLPPESSAIDDFRSLNTRMTWADDKTGEGTVPATLALITEDEARAIAGLIVDIYSSLTYAIFDAQRKGERWGAHHETRTPG